MVIIPSSFGARLTEVNHCHTKAPGHPCHRGSLAPRHDYKKGVTVASPRGSTGTATTIGALAQTLLKRGLGGDYIHQRVKALVLDRAKSVEEHEMADFIADAEIRTARSLLNGDSKAEHTVTDSVGHLHYTPERLALHRGIIERMMVTNEEGKPVHPPMGLTRPVAIVMGGLPASGKTYAVANTLDNTQFVTVSNDRIKRELGQDYEGKNAAEFHEESSDIAETQFRVAIGNRQNLIYDFTGKTLPNMRERIKTLMAAGYDVELRFTDVDVEDSVRSALLRAGREQEKFHAGTHPWEGRYVPLEHMRNALRAAPPPSNVPAGTRTSEQRQTYERLKRHFSAFIPKNRLRFTAVDNRGLLTRAPAKQIEKSGPLFGEPGYTGGGTR